jgi:hypothetical protein
MVKFSRLIPLVISLSFVLVGGMAGCASHHHAGDSGAKSGADFSDEEYLKDSVENETHLVNLPVSAHPVTARKLWTRKSPGLLTDLNISRDGSTVLVATVPDRDSVEIGANRSRNFAAIFSSAGKSLAQIEMPAQIKSQTISADGSLSIIATYDDAIRGYDRSGKKVWEHEGICKPIALSSLKKILCFHDDDSDPELAFEVLDWSGNKVGAYPVKLDSLMIKVSQNEKYFVVGLNHGKILLFDSIFKLVWQKSVDGELTDLAISSSESGQPTIAALYNVKKTKRKHKKPSKSPQMGEISSEQKVALFNNGKSPVLLPIHSRLDELDLSADGKALFGYGNDADGQVIVRISEDKESKDVLAWKRGDPKPAEYSSQLLSSQDWVWIGFEDMNSTSRHSHVLGFDNDGGVKTNITVPSEEGSYLYAYSYADRAHILAVGSDDGRLSLFEVK